MTQKNIILEPDWGFDIGTSPQLEIRHVEIRGDILYVLGVAHSSITLGDRFTKITRFAPQINTQDRIGEDLVSVNLKVTSITAYHNALNRVNADMTAGIEMTGSWDHLLETLSDSDWTIADANSHQWRDHFLDSEKLILTK